MLCEEGVLDALGDSPQLSLTSKRALARVNRATRQGIFKHLRRDNIWVHRSDRTVANARWLIHMAETNPELCLHVFDAPGCEGKADADKPMGHLGFCVAMGKNGPTADGLTGLPASAIFVASQKPNEGEQRHPSGSDSSEVEEEDEEEAYKNASILDETVAWFMGHMLASLARNDVGIRTTNGKEINVSELAAAIRLYPILSPIVRNGLNSTDWAFVEGALYRNAMARVGWIREQQEAPRWKAGARVARFSKLRLNDDAMTHVGAKLQRLGVGGGITTLDFNGNCFGALGTSAIFCALPNPSYPSVRNRPNILYKKLLTLVFDFTPIGDCYGMQWLISAMAMHMLPELTCLRLVGVGMNSHNAHGLFDALGMGGGASKLASLNVSNNPFNGFGFEPMAKPAWAHPNLAALKVCFVRNVDSQGFAFLARAIMNGQLPNLRDVVSVGSRDCSNHCVGVAVSAHRARRAAEMAIQRAELPPPKPTLKCKPRKNSPPQNPFDDGGGETSSEEESDSDDDDVDDEEASASASDDDDNNENMLALFEEGGE